MLKRIHVNSLRIRRNAKHGTNEPVVTVKAGGTNSYCHAVKIHGPSTVVYAGAGSGRKPLSCGARVWVETEADITLIGNADSPLINETAP